MALKPSTSGPDATIGPAVNRPRNAARDGMGHSCPAHKPERSKRSLGQHYNDFAPWRVAAPEAAPGDVLAAYGGNPVARDLVRLAKRRDIPIVFWLHNFSYQDPAAFKSVDYVVVPSEFSRQYHWEKPGLACHTLPNLIDPQRVKAARIDPKYVTFVNPAPAKGVYVFVRIAEQLARRRPDGR